MTGQARSTRRFAFAAGHRYWVADWSPAENERRFGRLTVPHGHNYALDVSVCGPIDERTGMVIDLGELKRIVTETVVDRLRNSKSGRPRPMLDSPDPLGRVNELMAERKEAYSAAHVTIGVDDRSRYELVGELRRRWLAWQRAHRPTAAPAPTPTPTR